MQFFLIKRSNNFFSIKVLYYICLRHNIFNFFNHKTFFRPMWGRTFCKNISIFQYSYIVTNYIFRIFDIIFFLKLIYVLDFTSTGFILIVLWYFVLRYVLLYSLYYLIYQYTHFLILKSWICKFCSLRLLVGFRYGKKSFRQNGGKFGYNFIKNDTMFLYLLWIYKKPIILSLFKINILNFNMHILTILACPLKIYVIRLHSLISMNIFFTIQDHSFSL